MTVPRRSRSCVDSRAGTGHSSRLGSTGRSDDVIDVRRHPSLLQAQLVVPSWINGLIGQNPEGKESKGWEYSSSALGQASPIATQIGLLTSLRLS